MNDGKNTKKTNIEILYEITNNYLPEFCYGFLINRGNERNILSRIKYARNLKVFFEYAIEEIAWLYGKSVPEVLPVDMKGITPQDLDLFLAKYRETHEIRSTANMRSTLSNMYGYLVNTTQKVDKNPVLGAQKIKIQEKDYVIYLNEEEQERLLNAVKYGNGLTKRELAFHGRYAKRDLALIFLFLDTGLRASEICMADNQDLNLESCSIIVTRKGGKASEVFFSDEAAAYLSDYMEEKKAKFPLFCGQQDPLIISEKGNRLTVRQYENIIPKYVKAALPERYESINCHKLRSSFAMTFYAHDPNILTLQQRMNHKSLTTTNIYAKASQNVSKQTRNWREKEK